MIRVVLDTNIVVSALIQPRGPSARVFLLAMNKYIRSCISAQTYCEYGEVLPRPRLKIPAIHVASALSAILENSVWVRPDHAVAACSDPDDNAFLECAVAAGADYLVTGNAKHFPSMWEGTMVISPREFLALIPGGDAGKD
jgi:putative PIN family toxin of toxin-antitoxin system